MERGTADRTHSENTQGAGGEGGDLVTGCLRSKRGQRMGGLFPRSRLWQPDKC